MGTGGGGRGRGAGRRPTLPLCRTDFIERDCAQIAALRSDLVCYVGGAGYHKSSVNILLRPVNRTHRPWYCTVLYPHQKLRESWAQTPLSVRDRVSRAYPLPLLLGLATPTPSAAEGTGQTPATYGVHSPVRFASPRLLPFVGAQSSEHRLSFL